jgi:hypothetical protein
MRLARIAVCLASLAALVPPAKAQDKYPSRLITIIAPISPGTAIDILARLYADKLRASSAGGSSLRIVPVLPAANSCRVPPPTAHAYMRQFRPDISQIHKQGVEIRSAYEFFGRRDHRRGAGGTCSINENQALSVLWFLKLKAKQSLATDRARFC